MLRHIYIALVAMLLVTNSAIAHVSYVRVQWKEGIEVSEYVFRYDEDSIPRLYDTSRREIEEPPYVQVTDSFVNELEQAIRQGNVFSYAPAYEPAEALCGGYTWELEVRTEDGRYVRSSGHSVQPENSIVQYLELLMKSTVNRSPVPSIPL